jgi:hypothetical protein
MKKVLLTLTVAAGLAMTSCGGADMCSCTTDMMELGKKMEADGENEDLKKEFEAKAKECEEIGKAMQEGKTEEEIEAMGKEFMESCPAIKEAMGGH